MLPDFPPLKQELHRLLVLGVRAERPGASPLLAGFPRRPMNEGNPIALVRETGEEEERAVNDYTAHEILDLTEMKLLTLGEAYERYRDLASKIDEAASADLEELIDRTAESLGNVVELGGRPLPEGILEGVEKMRLLDDPKDVDQLFLLPQVRHMLKDMAPDALEEAREQMKRGAYKEQTQRRLDRKREERRVRESHRKLVG